MMRALRNYMFRARYKIGRALSDERYVFSLTRPELLDRRVLSGEEVFRFTRLSDIPQNILQEMQNSTEDQQMAEMESLFACGARLYVLMANGCFGSFGWVRTGCDIPRWTIPLQPDDRIVSRGYTPPRLRGQGLRGRCIAATFDQERTDTGRLLADCHVRNASSVRQLTRTGFEIIHRGPAPKIKPDTAAPGAG